MGSRGWRGRGWAKGAHWGAAGQGLGCRSGGANALLRPVALPALKSFSGTGGRPRSLMSRIYPPLSSGGDKTNICSRSLSPKPAATLCLRRLGAQDTAGTWPRRRPLPPERPAWLTDLGPPLREPSRRQAPQADARRPGLAGPRVRCPFSGHLLCAALSPETPSPALLPGRSRRTHYSR